MFRFLSFDPVLVCAGCYSKIWHYAASQGLRNFILWVLEPGNPRAQHQHGCALVKAFSWVANLVSSHGRTQRELCGVLVVTLIPFSRVYPHDLSTFQRPLLPNTNHLWGFGFQIWIWEGHKSSDHSWLLPYVKVMFRGVIGQMRMTSIINFLKLIKMAAIGRETVSALLNTKTASGQQRLSELDGFPLNFWEAFGWNDIDHEMNHLLWGPRQLLWCSVFLLFFCSVISDPFYFFGNASISSDIAHSLLGVWLQSALLMIKPSWVGRCYWAWLLGPKEASQSLQVHSGHFQTLF